MKTIFHSFILCALLLIPFSSVKAQDQTGDIKVTVLDEKNQPMPGAVVVVVSGGSQIGGATNMDGNYTFRALNPGTYSVEARVAGYKRYVKQGIIVNAGQTSYADYPMQVVVTVNDTIFTVYATRGPIDQTYSTVQNIGVEQLKNNAAGRSNLLSLVEGSNSQLSIGKGGRLVMRGSREGASTMYVDGEKMYGGTGVPGCAIEQVTVLSGGIPASFGDMTGGVVIITTKSYDSGISAKNSMYEAAAEEAAAAKAAELEKSGKLIEKDGTIIEQEKAPAPAPQTAPPTETPAVDGGGN